MKFINIIAVAIFLLTSCNKTNKNIAIKNTSNSTQENEQSEGYTLLKSNCYACHSITSKSHDEIIAPPMVAVKRRYLKEYLSKEDFVNAIVNWSKNPNEETALMLGAVKRFKVMPKQAFNEDDLKKIAEYIYENEIEMPDWFENHFNQKHKGPAMRKGMKGQNR